MAQQTPNQNTPTSANASRFLLLATVCIVVLALKFAQEVLIPVALAVLLTFLLAPLAMRLERRKIGRVPSVIIVVIAALAAIVGIGTVVFLQAEGLANDLPTYQDNIVEKLKWFRSSGSGVIDKFRHSREAITEQMKLPATTQVATSLPATRTSTIDEPLTSNHWDERSARNRTPTPIAPTDINSVSPLGSRTNPSFVVLYEQGGMQWETVQQQLGPILAPLGTVGLVIVFTIFMMLTREDLRDRLIRLIGHSRLTVTTQALSDASDRISRYLLMQTIVNGCYGLITAIGMWMIGVPNPLLFGLLCSILRFLPYVGPLIGMSFPIIVSIGKFSGFAKAGETIGLFVGVELFSNNVMEPWLYGSSTGISTVAVLVSAVFWTWVWGPVGLLLSTPLTVILVVLGKYVPQFAFLDVLLGDEAVLKPHERFYQRLLALDAEEATELAREFRKQNSLEHVYDEMLLPTLSLAERDRTNGLLEEDRQKFLRESIRDVIDELGDDERAELSKRSAENIEREAKGLPEKSVDDNANLAKIAGQTLVVAATRPMLPKDCVIKVVCLPAQTEADELVNVMLSQLLEFMGYCTESISFSKLSSERIDAVEGSDAALTVISALPPSAIAHSRYLLKRLVSKVKEEHIIVGLWLSMAEIKRSKERLSQAKGVRLATSLKDAMEQILQMSQPIVTDNAVG